MLHGFEGKAVGGRAVVLAAAAGATGVRGDLTVQVHAQAKSVGYARLEVARLSGAA